VDFTAPLSTLALAGATPEFFTQIATLLVAGAVIAYLGSRVRLLPIVGFLLAGVLIGPNALGLVRDLELVNAAAEVGVVLLLFTIGIEFSFEKLARIRRLIFGAGGLQVLLATGSRRACWRSSARGGAWGCSPASWWRSPPPPSSSSSWATAARRGPSTGRWRWGC
jgi:hypothetical protein